MFLRGFFWVISVVVCCALPCSSEAQPAQVYIDSAVLAMGGREALLALKSQRVVSHGESFEPEQTVQPGAEQPRKVANFTCTLLRDLNTGKIRYDWQRETIYPFPLTWKYTEIINGDEGAIIGRDGGRSPEKRPASAARMAVRRKELSRAPVSILLNALVRSSSFIRLADQIVKGRLHYVIAYTDRGQQVLLVLDAETRLLRKVIFLEDDPVAGDTQNELLFDNWRQVGAVKLPFSLQYRLNGIDVATETIDSLENDVAVKESDFEIPEDLKQIDPQDGSWGEWKSLWLLRRIALASPLDDLQTQVELVEVGKGVFHVTGGTHHSLAVEMKDHLIVVDAPLYEERSQAVITALESRFPGKPVRVVVSTHFHNDHSGGLRAYAALGATIVTGKASEAFVQKMLQASHTYVPDSLQKIQKPGMIETIDSERKSFTDGNRTVEAYPVQNGHAEGMLATYVPHAKLLFVSDLFSPGAPRQPPGWPRELLESLTAAGITVEHIVGGHGNKVATLTELRQAAAQEK